MTSEATVTIAKMLETLPEQLKGRVVEHLREYIADLRDEAQWNDSFSQTQGKLIEAAKQVRKEIAEGKATPFQPRSCSSQYAPMSWYELAFEMEFLCSDIPLISNSYSLLLR